MQYFSIFLSNSEIAFPGFTPYAVCAFKVSESWIQTSSKLPWSRIHFPLVTPAVLAMSLLERAVSRRDRPPAQLAEVKYFRFHLSTASLVSGSEGAFYVMEALSRAYSLGKETCGCRLSMKHFFSCESNKDKQRWIQAALNCGPLMPALSPLKSAYESSDGDSELLQLGCIFQDIETLGGCEAHCVVHGKLCPVPGCDLLVIGSSCEDLSKANPRKETQKFVFQQSNSLGSSVQTYHGFTSYVAAHSPGLVTYENVGGLEEQIGAHAQSNLDVLMQTMKELGYSGQPLRTDASSFGLPARRRRLYILFVRQVNPKLLTQTRSLTESFEMFNNMVASCLRPPPCAKDLLLNPASGEVETFSGGEEREERQGCIEEPQVFWQLCRPTHEVCRS